MAKFMPTYCYNVDGSRKINSYRISLQKTEVEKAGFKSGEEIKIDYSNGKIVISKIK